MTNEEAIKILTNHRRFVFEDSEEDIAIVMAISALSTKVEYGMISQREFGVFGELDGKTAFRKGEYIYTVEHLINQLGAETHGIVFIPEPSQIESARTQITNSNLKSESEKPIKHFGSIECPNCGRLLMLEEQTYDWCNGCKEYDTEKHCCHRYSSFIRETLQDSIKAVLEDIKDEVESLEYMNVIAVEDLHKIIEKHISGKEE